MSTPKTPIDQEEWIGLPEHAEPLDARGLRWKRALQQMGWDCTFRLRLPERDVHAPDGE
jgi:hypothetical protein